MISRALRSYLETALWSSSDYTDDGSGVPLDNNYSIDDIDEGTLADARADLEAFLSDNAVDIGDAWEQAAHDFWLTRNRHGAGFWDGNWPADAGARLTDAAHAYGEVNLYVGDDGLIYAS